jgi:small ligand-binding sensory domain FIST
MDEIMKRVMLASIPRESKLEIPEPSPELLEGFNRKNDPAKQVVDTLIEGIKAFQQSLDDEHEVGVKLASFGQVIILHIDEIKRLSSEVITFHGVDEFGQKSQLIQHISQLNFLLMVVKKQEDQPRRIGFQVEEQKD